MSDRTATEQEHELLCMLVEGLGFTTACRRMGDAGVRAAFQCISAGWIDRGIITAAGRIVASGPRRTTKFQITFTSPTDPDASKGDAS